ncbi:MULTISPECIES: thiamine ABC transporter substrate binding subunit [unclassified Sulfitobacter]|jgi:thiamine transport system substrate-binding protein|uniref:thiamine ABC transporter substrate binding subunit n=1 Tax=unclassified Sulfitobacter TaxID=196795 RepID=UPI0007C2C403|nr:MULTISPECIES: thiamine ABC transporter substrate binding subunit [unclassified Sulfitobacter]KZY04027.1 thiamine ABC transporter substrate-binding protein [Sulfitobacter sp. HI0023]KZY26229.1 thiamine ABC transporter substrate-binding protein [Sulfitobacter sp. HI0040]KZZ68521.1 thiamine ABC transporter substrate-binding protein [Sulfitobacter sp. HI0129]
MKYLALAAGLAGASAAYAQAPELTVYTYDSFVADWGPGPAIEKAFEEECGCDLNFVGMGDGAALLARLKLEGARTDADVVLGLDTSLIAAAKETGLFQESDVSAQYDLPIAWDDEVFVPYDWGYFAFVHEDTLDAPANFRALADSDLKIVIQDPRSSTPGLGLLMWVKQAYGDEAPAIWEGLADNIVTVTKGWSEAYGLFLEGEADMVLSYTTSPAYHLIAEEDSSKAAAVFDEGHYMQIEVAGRLAASDRPDLAEQFLRFMVSDAAQSILPTTNWMYPAVMPEGGLPEGFETLVEPEKALLIQTEAVPTLRDEALQEWLAALSR